MAWIRRKRASDGAPTAEGSVAETGKRHSGLRKSFLVVAGVLALVLAGGSAFSLSTIRNVNNGIGKVCVSNCGNENPDQTLTNLAPKCVRKVCNYLLLGSDSRSGFDKKQQQQFGNSSSVTGQRSDSILLVHLDIPDNRTTVLSIPRDLLVDIPGHGQDKINAAFDYGPNVLVKTVENLTGMQINHYVAINFTGFTKLVDAVGGVPVCVSHPMIDRLSGLYLRHTGCYHMDGRTALAFVRARHVEGDTIPDFSRISRQQAFFRALIQKIESADSIAHIPAIISALKHNLVVDQRLNIFDIQDLAHSLEKLGQGGVDFRVVPAVPTVINGIDYVTLVSTEADKCFAMLKANKNLGHLCKALPSTPESPATVRIQVFDANSGGLADKVATYLAQAGFEVQPVQPAPSTYHKSQMLVVNGQGAAKDVVHTYLPSLHLIKAYQGPHVAADIVVVIGAGYNGPGS
ncbi:MAG TPA: LCP family protein [Actinomycetota bacterium]